MAKIQTCCNEKEIKGREKIKRIGPGGKNCLCTAEIEERVGMADINKSLGAEKGNKKYRYNPYQQNA